MANTIVLAPVTHLQKKGDHGTEKTTNAGAITIFQRKEQALDPRRLFLSINDAQRASEQLLDRLGVLDMSNTWHTFDRGGDAFATAANIFTHRMNGEKFLNEVFATRTPDSIDIARLG